MNNSRTIARWIGIVVSAIIAGGAVGAVLSCGPSNHAPTAAFEEPTADRGQPIRATLRIENDNYYTAVVYLTRNGTLTERLATVPGSSNREVFLRARHLRDGHIGLAIRLEGDGSTFATDGTYVDDGAHPLLKIASHLPATLLVVYP